MHYESTPQKGSVLGKPSGTPELAPRRHSLLVLVHSEQVVRFLPRCLPRRIWKRSQRVSAAGPHWRFLFGSSLPPCISNRCEQVHTEAEGSEAPRCGLGLGRNEYQPARVQNAKRPPQPFSKQTRIRRPAASGTEVAIPTWRAQLRWPIGRAHRASCNSPRRCRENLCTPVCAVQAKREVFPLHCSRRPGAFRPWFLLGDVTLDSRVRGGVAPSTRLEMALSSLEFQPRV
jgi:hypothetical protein